MRVCAQPGCPELSESTYCERCRKAKRRASDAKRPSARARGYDARWERTRRRYLRLYPTCQDPEGCISPATDVHHIDGLGPSGPRGHDPDNLQALCHAHHSQHTAQHQPGGWASVTPDRLR